MFFPLEFPLNECSLSKATGSTAQVWTNRAFWFVSKLPRLKNEASVNLQLTARAPASLLPASIIFILNRVRDNLCLADNPKVSTRHFCGGLLLVIAAPLWLKLKAAAPQQPVHLGFWGRLSVPSQLTVPCMRLCACVQMGIWAHLTIIFEPPSLV